MWLYDLSYPTVSQDTSDLKTEKMNNLELTISRHTASLNPAPAASCHQGVLISLPFFFPLALIFLLTSLIFLILCRSRNRIQKPVWYTQEPFSMWPTVLPTSPGKTWTLSHRSGISCKRKKLLHPSLAHRISWLRWLPGTWMTKGSYTTKAASQT